MFNRERKLIFSGIIPKPFVLHFLLENRVNVLFLRFPPEHLQWAPFGDLSGSLGTESASVDPCILIPKYRYELHVEETGGDFAKVRWRASRSVPSQAVVERKLELQE